MNIMDRIKERRQVPEFLRDDKPQTTPYLRKRRSRMNGVQQRNRVLEYLSQNEGRQITATELTKHFGYKSISTMTRVLASLVKGKQITRIDGDNLHGYMYRVNRVRVNAPRKTGKPVVKTAHKRRGVGDNASSKVFAYIERHQGEFLTAQEIGTSVNLSMWTVYDALKRLRKANKLECSEVVHGKGRRYRVPGNGHVPDSKEGPNLVGIPEEKPEPAKPNNDARLLEVLEPLVWEFVKTTRSTDILVFLTYLEQRRG